MIFFKKKNTDTIDNSKDVRLNHVYTDKEKNKYYTFKNFLEISAKRALAAEKACRYIDMYVTEAMLKDCIDKMKQEMNKNNLFGLASIVNELDIRMKFVAEEDTLLELGACYFFFENESPAEYNYDLNKEKLKLWKKDEEAYSFFLSMALKATTKYSNISEKDLLNYLSENKKNADRLVNLIYSEN